MTERSAGTTPAQTVGPFLHIVLPWADGPDVVPAGTPGALTVRGTVYDGAGDVVPDALVETWQLGPGDAPAQGFRGFGRSATDDDGGWWVRTLKPAASAAPGGGREAPHLDVSLFARGLLTRLVTRVYFPDEAAANAADPVLAGLETADRERLVGRPDGPGALRFDIRLQGAHETPFFLL